MMDSHQTLDILAFGAHPDDVEIGMAGTIAKHVNINKKVGICDLTQAELSSNGNVEIRQQEASKASELLGLTSRFNLSFPDRGLYPSEDKIKDIVKIIRLTKPRIIFSPYPVDRHPDHGMCTKLVEDAVFSAGIKKFLPEIPAHKVTNMYLYMINGYQNPEITVDISDFIDTKRDVLSAYESQFMNTANSVKTPLTEDYVEAVIARERVIGKALGVKYAEGFFTKKATMVNYF